MTIPFMRPLLFALLLPVAARAEDGIVFPGTSWSIIPPAGFSLVRDPDAALQNSTGATMVMMQLEPGLADDTRPAVGEVTGDAPDRELTTAVTEITRPDGAGLLIETHGVSNHIFSLELHLATATSTIYIVAAVPEGPTSVVDLDVLRQAMLDVVETATPLPDAEADLAMFPLVIGDRGGLRVFKAISEFVFLTDRPVAESGPSPDTHLAMITSDPLAAADIADFDAKAYANWMTGQMRTSFPGIEVLYSGAIAEGNGAFAQVILRRSESPGVWIRMATFYRPLKSRSVLLVAQYPDGEPRGHEPFRTIFTSISER